MQAAPAFAETPEKPGLSVETPVHATEAVFEGTLNPNKVGITDTYEHDFYEFLYKKGLTCTGGSKTTEQTSLGVGEDKHKETATGLEPGTEYTVCLRVQNEAKTEEASSTPVSFTTAIAPETPETSTPTAAEVTASTVELHGVLNPNNAGDPGSYEFRYRQGAECEGEGGKATYANSQGHQKEVVSALLTGLTPGREYTFCLLARNPAGETATSTPVTFATVPAAALESGEALNVTASSAELTANVDPNGLPVSACEFEYGTNESYGLRVPCAQSTAQIGEGSAPVPVSAAIGGLHANTAEYHWRLLVTNSAGTTVSVDHTFVYPVGVGGLPDGRQYEMVTPPQKNGALIGAVFAESVEPEVGENNGHLDVVASSIQCLPGSQACGADRQSQGQVYEFTRSSASSTGWAPNFLAPPLSLFEHSTPFNFNANTGTGFFAVPTSAGESFYGRTPAGSFVDIGTIGEAPTRLAKIVKGSEYATADLSHFVYETETPEWPSFDTTHPNGTSSYEYEGYGGGPPRLVGIAPGSSELVSKCGTSIGSVTAPANFQAVSEDGETVYFAARTCSAGKNDGRAVPADELYVRFEHARSELVSTPSPGVCETVGCLGSAPGDAEFIGGSSDGSRVFFTDTQQLTDTASEDSREGDSATNCPSTTEGFSGCNLYESECPERCKTPAARRLVDVSAGDTSGGGPRVQGIVGIATNGSHIYFVARGTLTSTPNSQGKLPEDGRPNLYFYERDTSTPGGHLAYVATLSGEDEREWEPGDYASVTPDGRFLVFTSHRALTSDDTRPEGGRAQVYRYDSQTATLARISVGSKGFNENGNQGTGEATIVPSGIDTDRQIAPPRPDPTMSDDGSFVFFSSPIGLTPQALNDVPAGNSGFAENIYEWHEGEVSLISDGKDIAEENPTAASVQLIGSDASGANVVFATSDQLVPQDTDDERDYYDAHICTASEPCPPIAPVALPPCGGEVCHGTPAAVLSPPSGGTLAFNGQGNLTAATVKVKSLTRAQKLANALKACKKENKKAKRATCERQAKAKYGPTKKKAKSKKASNDRRVSR